MLSEPVARRQPRLEQVGEDALGLMAAADGSELSGGGTQVVQCAADLDQAVVQLVHGLGILVGIVLVVLHVDALNGGGWLLVTGLKCSRRRRWCEQSVDGEVDGGVDDGAAGAQLRGLVVDGEHRVLAVLGEDGGEGAQPGGAGQLADLLCEGDALVAFEREQDGALGADLLGVGGGQAVEGVLGVGAKGAEAAGEVSLAVLQAPQVGGEPGEVGSGFRPAAR